MVRLIQMLGIEPQKPLGTMSDGMMRRRPGGSGTPSLVSYYTQLQSRVHMSMRALLYTVCDAGRVCRVEGAQSSL